MERRGVFAFVGVLCTLLFADVASLNETGALKVVKYYPRAHLVGGTILGRYDHHTYAIRLKLSNSTKQTTDFRYCSGVRLSDGWLMTAAECLQIPHFKYIRITSPDGFGFKHYYYEIEVPAQRTRSELTFKIHPEYNPRTKANNVALIKSDFVSVPHKSLNPLLPYVKDRYEDLVGKSAEITSYENIPGHFADDDKEYVTVLRLAIVSPLICKQVFFPDPTTTPKPRASTTPSRDASKSPTTANIPRTRGTIPPPPTPDPNRIRFDADNFFCVATPPAKGPTKKDLGSPLIYQENRFSEKKLIGILAAVSTFTGNQNYALFAKVHTVSKWISETTGIPLVYQPKYWN